MPKNSNTPSQKVDDRLILKPVPQSPSAAVVVMVGAGSRYESEDLGGISHFLEHMVFKGTTRRPNTLDIASAVDGVGGEFNAFTSKEYTGFYIKTASKDISLAIDLLSDMLFNSKFEEDEIERERGVILEEMNMYLDSPRDRVGEIYDNLVYPSQALGRDVIGSKSSLANIKRQDLLDYLHKWYVPNNFVVGVAGGFDKNITKKMAFDSFFNREVRALDRFEPAKIEQDGPNVVVVNKETDQTHMVLGVRSFSMSDPRRYALALLNVILGGNMSSRLFTQIRERRGLAYAVHTGVDHYLDAGTYNCQVGLDHNRVEETIKVTLEQFALIRDELVSDEELARAKSYLRGRLSLSLEDPLGLSMYVTKQKLLLGNIVSVEQYLDKIDSLTAEDVNSVARDIFKQQQLNLALIGPQSHSEKLRELLIL